ncbi:hypothetical protein ACUN0C_00095 [Faunimonas sp. B44]|uniref:hypothetical protein n=1 Tax=Faunimonas sp. B44 TaxID=3461493 RepID=UPI004045155E
MAPKPDSEKLQIERFRDAARELGCDDNENRFMDALRQISKAPPVKQEPRPKSKKSE